MRRIGMIMVSMAVCMMADVWAEEGWTDPRVRTLIMPQRVMWTSANTPSSRVENADILLKEKHGQVPEGIFLAGSGCRMENKGAPASLLVDFGRELHGGVQLASGGPSKKLSLIHISEPTRPY